MSIKLASKKKWLTLDDAAKYLSLSIDEEVTTADLLQLAIEKDLTLSVNLVNQYPAVTGKKVPLEEAELYRFPLKGGEPAGGSESITGEDKGVFVDAITGQMLKNYSSKSDISDGDHELLGKVVNNAVQSPDAEYAVYFLGDLLPDYSGVIEFDRDSIHFITGLWDLPMIGAESFDIEEAFHAEVGGPRINLVKLCGVLLKSPVGNQWANLYERFSNKQDGIHVQDFCPRESLPEEELIVVHQNEVQRFADSLNESENNRGTSFNQEAVIPEQLDILNTAFCKFWRNASRTDKGTWPTNEFVTQWLMAHHFSRRNAQAGASIIRPDWAKHSGRPPEQD